MFILVIIALAIVANSAQPVLMGFGFLTLLVNFKLHWRSYQPKTIFFALLLFWLSIIVLVVYSDIYGLAFESLSISSNIVQTAHIAMTALLIFSLSIYLVTRSISNRHIEETDSNLYDTKKVLLAYLFSIVFITLVDFSSRSLGLGEISKALGLLRQSLVFVMIYVYYKKNGSLLIPVLLISIEVALSFFSFFSSFKDILILFIVCFTYFKIELKFKQLLFLSIVSVGAIYLLLIWQAVKGDYRSYLNGGERSQTVVVDRSDALNQFLTLASTANINDQKLWFSSLDRLSYIEFFSEATDNVPQKIAHTDGTLWRDNIIHVLVPRLLYKDKKAIYDSEMVNTYATRKVAGADVGTSFSLGWLAESYIDFGYWGMFIPVLLLGLFCGYIYRYIYLKSYNQMWGCAFVAPLWVYFNNNGTPGSKVLGWLIIYLLVYFIVNKYLIKRLDNLLRVSYSIVPIDENSLSLAN